MWLKKALLFSLVVALPTAASAGEVYKCTVGSSSVFQDKPCANGKKIEVTGSVVGAAASGGGDIHSMSLVQMSSRLRESSDAERHLVDDMNREIAEARARRGPKATIALTSEIERIQTEYRPKIDRAHAASTAIVEEIRKRCPKGAVLNDASTGCGS
ncbi:DUF4124 domain-containing protein [Luteibacter aegosomatissinici]|uniref:DUF4124 domain-containing protein n=1 Tax=Luteibacter aegosomatissinici TaxID=2911539 RepID=UPI001FFB8483|nr:DUF4124 domain-containing protein [Luteibacter aegosomatissinici]UPG94319.1 DUF4124 domain-containing protein [Luteibacter aegosomatissinici]